jgi:hypothetical protein
VKCVYCHTDCHLRLLFSTVLIIPHHHHQHAS